MEKYENTRITYIYGLYEVGKENEIRYVGKSDNPNKRVRDHRNDKSINPKTSWVKSIINKGGEIGIKILKVVDYNIWQEEEIKTIKEYSFNFNLKNYHIGGNGGNILYHKSYEECINWLRINKPDWVLNSKDYKKWSIFEDFPSFLPIAPQRVFENFKWSIYLNNNLLNKDRFLLYEDAKKWIYENFNFKSSTEYRKSDLPYFLPKKPYNTYKKEWVSWSEFLNFKPFKRDKNSVYYSYEDAKKWIKDNMSNLTAQKYRNLSNILPSFIPSKPERTYKDEWINWYDWLGKEKG
jgi:hypothetical protein